MPSMTDQSGLTGPLAVLSALVLLYSIIIARQILLGIIAVAAVWFLYLLYRLVLRLGRIATALERLVDERTEDGGNERA